MLRQYPEARTSESISGMTSIKKAAYKRAIRALPPKMAIGLMYFSRFGRFPSFSRPKDFTEKIQVSKLTDRDPLMTLCSDKVLVKDYVAGLIGAKHVIPTLWSGVEFTAREALSWPIPFVIKANHASGTNHFVRSQEELDWAEIKTLCKDWLAKSFGRSSYEWAYQNIKRQLLVEPFISCDRTLPLDYKIFVFNGVSHFIQVHTGRENNHETCYFDRTWTKCDITSKYPVFEGALAAPRNLEQMLHFAEIVSGDFPFVRCDFYEVEGHLYFGEMTFYPDSGFGTFRPREWNRKLGDLWG